jgi:hypothetical protein
MLVLVAHLVLSLIGWQPAAADNCGRRRLGARSSRAQAAKGGGGQVAGKSDQENPADGLALQNVTPGAVPAPVLSAAFLLLMALELLRMYGAGPSIVALANGAVVIALLLCTPLAASGLRERFLLLLALPLVAAVLALASDPIHTFSRALAQAGFLMSFILLLGLLREAAQTSPAILACGSYLTRQREGWRYLSLQGGSHFIGVIINFGAIALLAPLVQRGIRANAGTSGLDARAIIHEQRQLAALLRGMPWVIVWAPTTVTQALLPSVISGIDGPRFLLLGLVVAAVVFVLGAVEDQLRWRRQLRALDGDGLEEREVSGPFPWRAFFDLLAVCAGLAGFATAIVMATGVPTVAALMVSAPLMLVVWLMAQHADDPAPIARAALVGRLRHIIAQAIPSQQREVMILGLSGFIGICVAAVAPVDQIADLLRTAGLPAWLLLSLLTVLVFAGAQIGLTPIMTVVVLANVLGAMSELPADPTLLALALAAGWALAMVGGPFSSLILLLSRISGYDTMQIAWKWNLPYSLATIAALTAIFAWLAP